MRNPNKYDWRDVVHEYLSNDKVQVMTDVVVPCVKVDKQAEAIYGQLLAVAWGIA